MSLASGSWLGRVGTCPEGMTDGFAGPFHEGLAEDLRALEAPVDPARLPAPCGSGRHARLLVPLSGGGIALAWFATGDEETRGEDGAGAWERLKGGEVGWVGARGAIARSQSASACKVARRWATRARTRQTWGVTTPSAVVSGMAA
jgi:hypothetical protein